MAVSSPSCRHPHLLVIPSEWADRWAETSQTVEARAVLSWAARPAGGAAVGSAHPITLQWGRRPSPSPASAKVPAWCDPTKCFVVPLETGSGNPRSQNALLNKAEFHPSSSAWAQPCHNPQNHSEYEQGWCHSRSTPWVYLYFCEEVICKSTVNPTMLYNLKVARNDCWQTTD